MNFPPLPTLNFRLVENQQEFHINRIHGHHQHRKIVSTAFTVSSRTPSFSVVLSFLIQCLPTVSCVTATEIPDTVRKEAALAYTEASFQFLKCKLQHRKDNTVFQKSFYI